jgi:hypothetical protein
MRAITVFLCLLLSSVPRPCPAADAEPPREIFGLRCAAPFEHIARAVSAHCAGYRPTDREEALIDEARRFLVAGGYFRAEELAGVDVLWCPLSPLAHGLTPDGHTVYLSTERENDSLVAVAALLAHELTHIRQFRRMGAERFGCDYSLKFLACGGCQDERHPLEREAYDLQKKILTENGLTLEPGP